MNKTNLEPPASLNLRKIRQEAELSLSQASDLTGVSKAMLGQIERGESSPTIATLWKLCKGFRLPLTALVDLPGNTASVFKPDLTEPKHFREGMPFYTVFPFDPKIGTETFRHDIEPGQSHLSAPHVTGMVEDILVVKGNVEILLTDRWQEVTEGTGLRFAADQPHGYRNPTDAPAQFYNILNYPQT